MGASFTSKERYVLVPIVLMNTAIDDVTIDVSEHCANLHESSRVGIVNVVCLVLVSSSGA